jgi:hypothetical protein
MGEADKRGMGVNMIEAHVYLCENIMNTHAPTMSKLRRNT